MGRYALFDTGFEYKFAFALQSSTDMLDFGGSEEGSEYDTAYHSWSTDDLPVVEEALQGLQVAMGFDPVDFDKYEKNDNGTYKMYRDVRDGAQLCSRDEDDFNLKLLYRYALGCIIYHQLLYKSPLSVKYEL
jgi:hypothetical protein